MYAYIVDVVLLYDQCCSVDDVDTGVHEKEVVNELFSLRLTIVRSTSTTLTLHRTYGTAGMI